MKARRALDHIVQGRGKGQVVVLMALAVVVFIGFMSLAIDIGVVVNARRELVRLADASALAAAGALSGDPSVDDATRQSRARARAREYASFHSFDPSADGHSLSVSFPSSTPARKLVEVTASRDVDLYFAKVFGKDKATVSSGGRQGEAAPLDVVIVQDVSGSQCEQNYVDPNLTDGCDNLENPWKSGQGTSGVWEYRANQPTRMPTGWPPSNSPRTNVPWQPFATNQYAARYFVDHLDSRYDQVGLVSFSSKVASDSYGEMYRTQPARLHAALTSNFAAVKNAIGLSPTTNGAVGIKGLYPNGGTNMAAGVKVGVQALLGAGSRETAVGAMVLITDGTPTNRLDDSRSPNCDSSHPQYCSLARGDVLTQVQTAKDQGIVIYTIFVGSDEYEANAGLILQWIADLTDNRRLDGNYGGTRNLPSGYGPPLSPSPTENYYHARNLTELQAAYDEILSKIYTRLVK